MRFLVDIDGVLTNRFEWFTREAEEHFQKPIVDKKKYNMHEAFAVTIQAEDNFYERQYPRYEALCPPRPGAKEFFSYLFASGHEAVLYTNRVYHTIGSTRKIGEMKRLIKEFCSKIVNCPVIFSDGRKRDIAEQIKPDYVIEDNPITILNLSKDFVVFKMNAPYNENIEGENIIPIDSFQDVITYLTTGGNKYERP